MKIDFIRCKVVKGQDLSDPTIDTYAVAIKWRDSGPGPLGITGEGRSIEEAMSAAVKGLVAFLGDGK